MKTLLRALFLLTILFRPYISLVLGDLDLHLPKVFTNIGEFKTILDLEIKYLKKYNKGYFLLSVKDTTSYSIGYYEGVKIWYDSKNEILYLVGEFDDYKNKREFNAYCFTLVRISLVIAQCGYCFRIVESEEAINDDAKGFMELKYNPNFMGFIFEVNGVQKREMFDVATQILMQTPSIKEFILKRCGPNLEHLHLKDCLAWEISFAECELQANCIESLLQCNNLRVLGLYKCRFLAGAEEALVKILKTESSIKFVDLTDSTFDSKTKRLLWFWGRIRSIKMVGIGEDNPEDGSKYYEDVYLTQSEEDHGSHPLVSISEGDFEDWQNPSQKRQRHTSEEESTLVSNSSDSEEFNEEAYAAL